jgi:hypothetical protein
MKTPTAAVLLGITLGAFPAAAEGPRVLYDDVSNQHFPLQLQTAATPAATTSPTSTPTASPTPTSTTSPTPASTTSPTATASTETHENRSGLGDGTNPGAGAEHNAGKNQGTDNPGGLKKQ